MLSFKDCAAMSGLTDGEIAMVAKRRNLPATIAIACAVQEACRLQRLKLEDTPPARRSAPAPAIEVVALPEVPPSTPVPAAQGTSTPDPERLPGASGLLVLA